MKEAKCPRCQAIRNVRNDTGTVECYCGYTYEIKEDKKIIHSDRHRLSKKEKFAFLDKVINEDPELKKEIEKLQKEANILFKEYMELKE
jgi:hypothetical protein